MGKIDNSGHSILQLYGRVLLSTVFLFMGLFLVTQTMCHAGVPGDCELRSAGDILNQIIQCIERAVLFTILGDVHEPLHWPEVFVALGGQMIASTAMSAAWFKRFCPGLIGVGSLMGITFTLTFIFAFICTYSREQRYRAVIVACAYITFIIANAIARDLHVHHWVWAFIYVCILYPYAELRVKVVQSTNVDESDIRQNTTTHPLAPAINATEPSLSCTSATSCHVSIPISHEKIETSPPLSSPSSSSSKRAPLPDGLPMSPFSQSASVCLLVNATLPAATASPLPSCTSPPPACDLSECSLSSASPYLPVSSPPPQQPSTAITQTEKATQSTCSGFRAGWERFKKFMCTYGLRIVRMIVLGISLQGMSAYSSFQHFRATDAFRLK